MRFLTLGCIIVVAGCTSVDEDRWKLYNESGIQAFATGHYQEALECFDLALTRRPQDAVLLYNAGQCHDRLGQTAKAEQCYTYCIQDSKHGDARLALIELYYRTGRTDLANQKIQEWLKQDPRSPVPYVADAWRLRKEKNYPQAQARVQQALSLDPRNRLAMTELAVLYEIDGMKDLAYVQYERILDQDPNQIEIRGRLDQLKVQGVSRPVRSDASGAEKVDPLMIK